MHCMGAFVHGEAAAGFWADFSVIEEMEPWSLDVLVLGSVLHANGYPYCIVTLTPKVPA